MSHVLFRIVKPPKDFMCKGLHEAKGVKFFKVQGGSIPFKHWGIYCEDCIKAVNNRAKELKESKSTQISPLKG